MTVCRIQPFSAALVRLPGGRSRLSARNERVGVSKSGCRSETIGCRDFRAHPSYPYDALGARLLPVLGQAESDALRGRLEEAASHDRQFHLLIVFSCTIATLGLIADSPAVVIGAMLVAPLLGPILALALGSVVGRPQLLGRAAFGLIEGVIVSIVLSTALAWLARELPFDVLVTLPHEAQIRTSPNPLDLGIALAGGAAGAYALSRIPGSDAIPGVAIATALMPPLCTIGIGISTGDRGVWGGAGLLFVTNLSAIVFAGIAVFLALGLRPRRWHAGALPAAASVVLLIAVAVALVGLTLRTIEESRQNQSVRTAIADAIERQRPGSELVSLEQSDEAGALSLRVTVRTSAEVSLGEVESIQARVAQRLQRRVALVFVSVPAVVLDPLNPPAKSVPLTPAPTPMPTPTLSPRTKVITFSFQASLPALARD